MTQEVALVGCSKVKSPLPGAIHAKDRYRGRLARLGYEYARAQDWDVFFVSALHLLVNPFEQIEDYDVSMASIKVSQHIEWGGHIVRELQELYWDLPLRIVFLTGKLYSEPIVEAAALAQQNWAFEHPLEGLDLFQRMAWFKAHSTNEPP
jgi:hypothetical protein